MSVNKKNSDGSYNQYASKPYVTKDNIGLSKVENKSSEDIRGEITSKNVTDALGYTPVNPNPQFIYDTDEKMTKIVPENVSKGIVKEISGKTQKMVQVVPESSEWVIGTCPSVTVTTTDNVVTVTRYDNNKQNIWSSVMDIMMNATHRWLGIVKFMGDGSKTIEAFIQFHGRYSYKAIKDNEYLVQAFTGTSVDANKLHVGVKFDDNYLTVKFDKRVQVFDLTAMFGAGNEPTEDEFIEMFGYGYIPYTAGSLWNTPVERVVLQSKNLITKWMPFGIGISSANGLETTQATSACTDFIPVIPSSTITASGMGTASFNFIAWYDENKKYIERTGGGAANVRTQVLPATARYVRLSWYGATTIDMYNNNKITIVYGDTALPYTPYNKTTHLLDKIVDKLPDYGASAGDVYNYVDFEEMIYHHKVKKIKFGDMGFAIHDASSVITTKYFRSSDIPYAKAGFANSISAKYEHGNTRTYLNSNDKSYSSYNDGTTYIVVRDDSYSSYATESEFNKANANTEFVYELAEEELIPLIDLLLPFKCEPGGTVTFENEHNLDVPNVIIYEKEMK